MNYRAPLLALAVAGLLAAADPQATKARDLAKAGKYDEAISTLETAYKAKPKSAELKTALAETHLAHADYYMYNEQMPPMRKYPTALRQYRAVLQYDKTNKKALDSVKTIEDIYKSMGRPVPQ